VQPNPLYAPGKAEVWWEYADDGSIERIDLGCGGGMPYVVAERDENGRVARWIHSFGLPTELIYDSSGMLTGSSRKQDLVGVIIESTGTYEYRDDGRLSRRRFVTTREGVPIPDQSGTTNLGYESGQVSTVETTMDVGCATTGEYGREDGRLTSFVLESTCMPYDRRDEIVFEWSGDQLSRAHRTFESEPQTWGEEIRYLYDDDRLAEVQRDRAGQPHATYWFDYDADGRLTHLLWWGHDPDRSY
jgi:hypothetical protein